MTHSRLALCEELKALLDATDQNRLLQQQARDLELRRTKVTALQASIREDFAKAVAANLSVRLDSIESEVAKKKEGIAKFTQIGKSWC